MAKMKMKAVSAEISWAKSAIMKYQWRLAKSVINEMRRRKLYLSWPGGYVKRNSSVKCNE
jgi:hypothetical protein